MANLGIQNKNSGNLRDPATGNFQVFNSTDEGDKALINDLNIKKSGQSAHIKPGGTLMDLASVWAPASDGNKPNDWANNVAKTVGVTPDAKWADIPTDKLAQGIKVAEGTSTPQQVSSGSTTNSSNTSFAQKIKAKYPQYSDMPDDELTQKMIAKYPQYKDMVQGGTTPQPQTNKRKTFQEMIGDTPSTQPDQNLQVDNMGSSFISRPLALEQGLGYALSNAMGTQDKVIEAQNQGEDIETQLLKRIKEKKARGEDTTRLQKAFNQLVDDLGQSSKNISDIGTGGITNNQVLTSDAEHVLAYAGARTLPELLRTGLKNPEIKTILEGSLGKGETLANLSTQDAQMTLTNYLREMPMTEIKSGTASNVIKALNELNPTLGKEGLFKTIMKGTFNLAKQAALYKVLGDTFGGLVHQNTNLK